MIDKGILKILADCDFGQPDDDCVMPAMTVAQARHLHTIADRNLAALEKANEIALVFNEEGRRLACEAYASAFHQAIQSLGAEGLIVHEGLARFLAEITYRLEPRMRDSVLSYVLLRASQLQQDIIAANARPPVLSDDGPIDFAFEGASE